MSIAIASSLIPMATAPVRAQSASTCTDAMIIRVEGRDANFVRDGFRFDAYRDVGLCIDDVVVAETGTTVRVRCASDGDLRLVNGAVSVREICSTVSGTVSGSPATASVLKTPSESRVGVQPFNTNSPPPLPSLGTTGAVSRANSYLTPPDLSPVWPSDASIYNPPAYNPPPRLDAFRVPFEERAEGYIPIESCNDFSPPLADGRIPQSVLLSPQVAASQTATPWNPNPQPIVSHGSNFNCPAWR